MSTQYARVVRWSIALTGVVAAAAVVLCAALGGAKGAYGSLIGVGVVAVFFGISIVVVGRAAKVSPMAMMVAALGSFLVKVVAFMIVLVAIGHSTAFNGRMLGFTALACILAWSAAQVATSMKLKMLYVEPGGKSLGDDDRGHAELPASGAGQGAARLPGRRGRRAFQG
jgi:ATP synthase protein I